MLQSISPILEHAVNQSSKIPAAFNFSTKKHPHVVPSRVENPVLQKKHQTRLNSRDIKPEFHPKCEIIKEVFKHVSLARSTADSLKQHLINIHQHRRLLAI